MTVSAPKIDTQKQALRDFPWWIAILAGAGAIFLFYLALNPEAREYYASAFAFVWPGVFITLQVTSLPMPWRWSSGWSSACCG
jgi:hypothetical protein